MGDWHAHRTFSKAAYPLIGQICVLKVRIDNWDCPDHNAPVRAITLSSESPGLLHIPQGYAISLGARSSEARVLFLAEADMRQADRDDYRWPRSQRPYPN